MSKFSLDGVSSDISRKQLHLVLDTGSSLSLIKLGSIETAIERINGDSICTLQGVAGIPITTLGVIEINLDFNGFLVPFYFSVVPDDFILDQDGILGEDFCKTYNCTLDYKAHQITIHPRCSKQILKITEQSPSNNPYFSQEHTEKVLKVLRAKFPEQHAEKLETLCREYSNVFAVEGDRLTVNNFYQQELRVTDPEPVTVRQYPIPIALRGELRNQVNQMLQNHDEVTTITRVDKTVLVV